MDPRRLTFEVRSMFLEIPLPDFDLLPSQLGCSLLRGRHRLVLAAERPGCALTFDVEADRALLALLEVREDPGGRFFREVVGALFLAYQGDLDGVASWSDGELVPVSIYGGETDHPLLAGALDDVGASGERAISLALLEQWLDDGQEAWTRYQQGKPQGAPGPE